MNQLVTSATLIILGIVLLLFVQRSVKSRKDTPETPYLKKAGIGLILFGIYFLGSYLLK